RDRRRLRGAALRLSRRATRSRVVNGVCRPRRVAPAAARGADATMTTASSPAVSRRSSLHCSTTRELLDPEHLWSTFARNGRSHLPPGGSCRAALLVGGGKPTAVGRLAAAGFYGSRPTAGRARARTSRHPREPRDDHRRSHGDAFLQEDV